MSAEYFLDTNILVYSFDARFAEKQQRAQALIAEALQNKSGTISWQVVQEFINVARHRFAKPISIERMTLYFDEVLMPLYSVQSQASLYRKALSIQLETQYRYYDCLIVSAALAANCKILYSEDLQNGREIDGLIIRNPFEGT